MGIFKKSKNSIDRCSFCNYKISPREADNPFCPNCGAEVLSAGEMTRILPQKVEIQGSVI